MGRSHELSPARSPLPQKHVAHVVKKKWLDLILSGKKTWEIRGTSTKNRRVVRLAQSGSGHLVGEIKITNCLRVSAEDLVRNVDKHCIADLGIVKYRRIFAWVLACPKRYDEPRPYHHPVGAIMWINLDARRNTSGAGSANSNDARTNAIRDDGPALVRALTVDDSSDSG